jgi:Holliday junction resolvase RusA-like endonuclease
MIAFFVEGRPSPGGSKRYVGHSKAGRAVLIDMGGKHTKDWRAAVAVAARIAHRCAALEGPVMLTIIFWMKRPRRHFNKMGIREDAPTWHTSAPDSTKLTRSTEDAMKGITWGDDAQVVKQHIEKRYTEAEKYDDQTTGAHITISAILKRQPYPKQGANNNKEADQ